ncbi:MAG: AIR synthase related protein [Chitinophagaceae bacterium]
MSLYQKRGVSAQKEEVHAATSSLDQGLYPNAFCKIYPDYLGGDQEFVSVMHADGAGTKSILAYMYWKETGDASVWKGIAQDAIVMNLDDLLCVGIYDKLVFNSTIDRNKHLIPGNVLSEIISGSQELFDQLKDFGVHIHYLGGETADVGDVVRTIAVNGTLTARWEKRKLITNNAIAPGNVIVGLAGFGKTNYEETYNSGIASNGLTSARHDMLSNIYAQNFPESFDPNTDPDVVYIGKHKLTDPVEVTHQSKKYKTDIGKLLLSPTRTFAPLVKMLLDDHFNAISGMIHCSGGGQTKCLKYVPQNVKIVKDNLFEIPPVFNLIQESSGADNREMYQVFNMGCRLELYTNEKDAQNIIALANDLGIDAQVIGHVEKSSEKCLQIHTPDGIIQY